MYAPTVSATRANAPNFAGVPPTIMANVTRTGIAAMATHPTRCVMLMGSDVVTLSPTRNMYAVPNPSLRFILCP
jgi:hypothetical protein